LMLIGACLAAYWTMLHIINCIWLSYTSSYDVASFMIHSALFRGVLTFHCGASTVVGKIVAALAHVTVGWCRLIVSKSESIARLVSALETKM